ncbi:hypothetical protein BY458DRAFT_490968 [Sporodiniella umbellata]|nr:hypothetical protein BY458DRAFT_490968 [Sporodiniella umbellata]
MKVFEKSSDFPENWFFIKNHSNGYVLMVENESQETGSPVVLSTIRTKDYSSQLWRYDPKGFIVNKKSGQVMDVAKGNAKAGVDIVQQISSEDKSSQKFGLSSQGHIFLVNNDSLVLGIKESFFSRREGLHVHLQLVDGRHLDRKEQRWDFVLPVIKDDSDKSSDKIHERSLPPSARPDSLAGRKSSHRLSFMSDSSPRSSIDQEEATRIPSGTFPDKPFLLKSDVSGLYISTEASTADKAGSQLSIQAFRKRGYESQLWIYESSTNRIVSKLSNLVLGIESNSVKDGAYINLTNSSSAQDKTQAWVLSPEGEVTLKSDPSYVLGFKDSWFGNREGAHLHIQKKAKGNQQQKFTVVLPIIKSSANDKKGVFPEGWFFVKSQAHGLVLTVLNTGTIAAEVEATKLDSANYSRQLWMYENGYLVNRASKMVLDIRGGSITSGATICQYTKKTENAENQLWELSAGSSIYSASNKNLVLTVKENELKRSALFLSEKKSSNAKGQCWNFVLPVFKPRKFTLAEFPSGWFFVRSYVKGSTTESPYVLTASEKSIELSLLDRDNWQSQLWSFTDGKLTNYSTDLVIHVDNYTAGSEIVQKEKADKKWCMTTDGYLLYSSEKEKLALSANLQGDRHKLILTANKYSQEHQWGFLVPKFGYRHGYQILTQWSVSVIRVLKETGSSKTIVNTNVIDHPAAEWPQGEFFIQGGGGYALVPEQSEAGSFVTMKQLALDNAEIFKWSYRNGYLVHVVSGYVLHIQDKWVDGAKLQLSKEVADDQDQFWTLKTNGQIVSQKNSKFGLNFVQLNGAWTVQISSTIYYAWRLLYGKYELRYSEKEGREISYLVSFRRIILTLRIIRKQKVDQKLVTRSYGVFPEGWLFIRSKKNPELAITVSDKKKGAQLILSKLSTKTFTRQLWRYNDDKCLVNMETNYVIDVAGGKLLQGANVIQWSPKFLRISQKNQIWGLSVDGHIHTKTNTNLILSGQIKEGAQLKLNKRSESVQEDQQWTFARPIFGKTSHTSYAAQQAHRSSLVIDKVDSNETVRVSKEDEYESVNKRVITRRWGVFPTGSFFIRCKNLALTVERDESSQKYRIVLRTLNFKQYKLQYWTYMDGYLVNAETGFVLDAQASEDVSVESAQTQVYLNEKGSHEGQFWDLGANGEIHLRSNERLVIGVSKAADIKEGALVGLQRIRVVLSEADNKQVTELKSDSWLHWTFSKPVFGKRAITSGTPDETPEVESFEDEKTDIQEQDEVVPENEDEEEEEYDDEDVVIQPAGEIEDSFESPIASPTPSPSPSDKTTASNKGVEIVSPNTVVEAVETKDFKPEEVETEVNVKKDEGTVVEVVQEGELISRVPHDAPSSRPTTPSPSSSARPQKHVRTKSNSSNRSSFQLEEHYVPTGFEKIVRYKNHQGGFPEGYFFIKSSLHGYVLELIGEVKDGAEVVLTKIKSQDFASQLWTCQNDHLVNLKGDSLVLDAAEGSLVTGERLHMSEKTLESVGNDDQLWDFTHEKFILLKNQRHIVLSIKTAKTKSTPERIEVYCQEAKNLIKKEARPEQRWEILVPALIAVNNHDDGVHIIEPGKVNTVSSSAATILSYKWLKETFCHRVTERNQWPSTEGWFFIRFGNDNHFIASGETSQSEIGLYEITEKSDYRRFLWTYVDGYLINYRYNLRLVLNSSRRWVLSNSHATMDQKFFISSNGALSIRISKIVYYIRFINKSGSYYLDVTTDATASDVQGLEMHIPVVSDTEYQKTLTEAHHKAYSFIRKQKTDWSILSASNSIRRAIFPVSTWFFVKASGAEELVLCIKDNESQLALKKLDLKNFKNQLWTFNDGHLINYDSKFVITVEGSVASNSKIIYSSEAGISTQKWILTTDGHIELEAHERFALSVVELKDSQPLILDSSNKPNYKVIQWKFSTPVFGKRTINAAKAIESGDIIEGEKEVQTISKANLALTRRSTKTAYDTYHETLTIVRWWKIVFLRRVSTCRTQKEYLQVLEEYRQILHSRLVQYITVCRTSIYGEELRIIEDFVAENEQLFEKHIFTKSLASLKNHKPEDTIKNLDLTNAVEEVCSEIEKKVQSIAQSKPKEGLSLPKSEMETVDRSVIAIDKVQITVRRYIIIIRRRVTEAVENNKKPEDIVKMIEDSHKELVVEIDEIQKDSDKALTESTYISTGYKKQLEESVHTVIKSSKNELEKITSNVEKCCHYTHEDWDNITKKLDSEITECKNTIASYDNLTEEEQPIVVEEDDIESARLDVVATVAETKGYIQQWFTNFESDLEYTSKHSPKNTEVIIDAAKLEVVSKLDETIALVSMLSRTLTYLTWKERYHLISYLITIKTHLVSSLNYIGAQPKDRLETFKIIFDKRQQIDLLKNIEVIIKKTSHSNTVEDIDSRTQSKALKSSEIEKNKTVKKITNMPVVNQQAIETSKVVNTVADKVTGALIDDKKTVSHIEDIVKDAKYVTVEVIADGKKTQTVIDTAHVTDEVISTHKDNEFTKKVVTGAVTDAIVNDKTVTSVIETIADTKKTVPVKIVKDEKEIDHTKKDQVYVIVKKTDEITSEVKPKVKTVEEIHTVVDVIEGKTKPTKPTKPTGHTGKVAEVKKTEVIETITTKPVTEVVDVTEEVTVIETSKVVNTVADKVTGALIDDKKTVSHIEDIVKDAKYVTVEVIADGKKTQTVIDTAHVTDEVISTHKDNEFTKKVVTGAVTDAIVNDKTVTSVIETIADTKKTVPVKIVKDEKEIDHTKKDQVYVIVKKTDEITSEVKPKTKPTKPTEKVAEVKKTEVIETITTKPVTEVVDITEEVTVIETSKVVNTVADKVTGALIDDKKTVSHIEDIVKDAKYVTVEVIADGKKTQTVIDTAHVTDEVISTHKDNEFTKKVVTGAVTDAIVNDKTVTSVIETIADTKKTVPVKIVKDEKEIDHTKKDQVYVIVKKTDEITSEVKPKVKTVEEIHTVVDVIEGKTKPTKPTKPTGRRHCQGSKYVTVEVIADGKKTQTVIDTAHVTDEVISTHKDNEFTKKVVTGAVTDAIVNDKTVTSVIETIADTKKTVPVKIVKDEKEIDHTKKDQVYVIVKKTDEITSEVKPKVKTVEEIHTVVDVIEGKTKPTKPTKPTGHTGKVAEVKKTEVIETITTKPVTEVVDVTEEVTVIETSKVVNTVADKSLKTVSHIEDIVKDAKYVTVEVIADGKKTQTVIDTAHVTDEVISTHKDNEFTKKVVTGAVTDAIVNDKTVTSVIETIADTKKTVPVKIVKDEKEIDHTKKDQVYVIVKKTDEITSEVKPKVKTVEEIHTVVDVIEGKTKPTKPTGKVAEVKKTKVVETVLAKPEIMTVTQEADKKTVLVCEDEVSSVAITSTTNVDCSSKPIDLKVTVEKNGVTETVEVVKDSSDNDITQFVEVGYIAGQVMAKKETDDNNGKTTITVARDVGADVVKNVEIATENTYGWLSQLADKINSMLEVGDCKENVEAVIASEESQLQHIIEKSKAESTTNVQGIDVYYEKLHETFKNQLLDIKASVNEVYTDNEVPKKIEFENVKENIKKVVDNQFQDVKKAVSKDSLPKKTSKDEVNSGSVTVVDNSIAKIIETVRYQNIEQAQKGTKVVVSNVVRDTQEKLITLHGILFGKIKDVIVCREIKTDQKKKDIQKLIADANEQVSVVISEGKKAFEYNYSVSDSCKPNVVATIQHAQKQAVDSFNNIQNIISTQMSTIEEVVISNSDFEIIGEKVSVIEMQSKRKAISALEHTTEAAISVGFEGKTVTWVETAELPESFKDVKVFAFDLPDTVVDYRSTISQIWNTIVSKKGGSAFENVNIQRLIVRWYNVFLEQRCKINYSTCDREVLLISLKLVLTEHSLEKAFTEEELNTLCITWFKLQPFGDSSSLKKINQFDKMYSVSISSGFKLCTLMKVARNANLSWDAQFTGDVFAACIARDNITDIRSTSSTVLSNAAMLCCLQDPSELAIVSSNPEILEAAKQNGSKTVLLDRYESTPNAQDYDVRFDGLDVFAESYETLHESKSTTKTEAPVTRSWFQRVVSTVSEAAESVTHAVIG